MVEVTTARTIRS